jgi:cell division protein FtsZ
MGDQLEPVRKAAVPRVLVLGVGSCGVVTVQSLVDLDSDLMVAAVDTDAKVLEGCRLERTIQVGSAVTNGFSAGGDVELGRQSIEKESSAVRTLLKQVDLLILVAGLGGGTGSGAAPVIARIARETGTMVLCLLSTPFVLEGKSAGIKSDEALKRLRSHSDTMIRIGNEWLVDRAETELTLEEAFKRSQWVMRDAIAALWRMISVKGVCNLDFASIHTMLRNCDGFCHFAHYESDAESGRAIAAAEGMIRHRLLGGGKVLKKASGVLIGLTGGHDLRLSEVEEVMRRIQEKLPAGIWINFGVNLDAGYAGKLSVVLLVAEQWKEPLMADERRQMGFSFSTRNSPQGEFQLEYSGKGKFADLDATIYDHQDLDTATYYRRGIKLPR